MKVAKSVLTRRSGFGWLLEYVTSLCRSSTILCSRGEDKGSWKWKGEGAGVQLRGWRKLEKGMWRKEGGRGKKEV